jgi:hypothetical protein
VVISVVSRIYDLVGNVLVQSCRDILETCKSIRALSAMLAINSVMQGSEEGLVPGPSMFEHCLGSQLKQQCC